MVRHCMTTVLSAAYLKHGAAAAGSAGGGSTQLSPKLGHTDSGFGDYMDIIDPADISLVKFLGSGGYGEVYLAKWHNSDVAVKCLNPSLFYQVRMSV